MLVYSLAVRTPFRIYNVVPFAPLIVVVLTLSTARAIEWAVRAPQGGRYVPLVAAWCVLTAFPALGGVRLIAHAAASTHVGVTYDEASAALQELERTSNSVTVTRGLFTLPPHDVPVVHRDLLPDDVRTISTRYLMAQQMGTSREQPVAVPGFRLIRDTFATEPPGLFGIATGRTPLAYNYAVYERTDVVPVH